MTFGEKVKEIRIRQGISQLQLGQKMNISQQAVAKYERLVDQPKLITVRKLADALEVSINELTLNWSDYSPDELFVDMECNESDYKNIDPRDVANENRILSHFHHLNYAGQEKAIEQVSLLTKIPEYQKDSSDRLTVQAAHERTDIDVTDEMRQHDDDIMNDENF